MKSSYTSFVFFTLADVSKVRLVEEGKIICGRWESQLRKLTEARGRKLVQDFVNWPNVPSEACRFVKLYGPIHGTAKAGESFRTHADLSGDQQHFRWLWEHANEFPDWQDPTGRGKLVYRNGRLEYQTSTLYDFLYLELVTCPAHSLRKCRQPNCETPYFIGHHRTQYCSDVCAGSAQKKWKREWWAKEGRERRRHARETE